MTFAKSQKSDCTSSIFFPVQFVAVLLAGLLTSSGLCAAAKSPNIVFIMADDMGVECLGSYGSAVYRTPNLDRLAATGLRFEHCYSTPLCTPSRVQIMTGQYNFRNYVDFGTLRLDQFTFGAAFKEQGYATCIAGKWQLGGDASTPRHFGFDRFCLSHLGGPSREPGSIASGRYAHPLIQQDGQYLSDEVIRDAYGPDIFCDYIVNFIEEHQGQPFFVYYPMVLVHSPFVPTPGSEAWQDPAQRDQKDTRNFGLMVAYADKLVGRIVDRLEQLRLLDNTMILFTGDNGTHPTITSAMRSGPPVKGGKGTMGNAGTQVPLIAYWKGVTPRGAVSPDLIDFSDFLPTLLEAGRIAPPGPLELDGRSFLPQIRGEPADPRRWVFCHYDPMVPFGGFQLHAGRWARNQRFKLYEDGRFYDLVRDPLEKHAMQSGEVLGDAASAKALLEEVHGSMPPWVERGAQFRDSEQNKKYLKELQN